ncbi:MAG: YbaK/EbsC family protein [Myxococcaceae bacterium]|nr:YbaK/EbsC family protein [Myxococcaceae bacterium]MCI0670475.1 YbaK/EbsC family protein [Myxococcaceae bacterium]
MIPRNITEYLNNKKVPFSHRRHRWTITAQHAAQSSHISGFRLAKTVVVEADGEPMLAVVPAAGMVDTHRLEELLGVGSVRLLEENEFESRFPNCELGAEPPFGGLYGMGVVMDESLREHDRIAFRAGTHDELLEMRTEDFERLEEPVLGTFAYQPDKHWYIAQHDIPAPM